MNEVFTVRQEEDRYYLKFYEAPEMQLDYKTFRWLYDCAIMAERSMVDGAGTNAK